MRTKVIVLVALSALSTVPVSAQSVGTQSWVPNLSGVFRCVQNCAGAGFPRITQYWHSLELINEAGQPSKAWIDGPGHIWIEAWNEGAVYSPNGFTIQFDRGSVWVLVEPRPASGQVRYIQ